MTRPDIVFVLCDDLGVNDLHCYGRADHRTPHLDALAAQGTRFTSACTMEGEPWRAGFGTRRCVRIAAR